MLDFAVKDLMVTVLPEQISAECSKGSNTACVETEPPCDDNTACKATEPPCDDNTACKATEAALRVDVGEPDFRILSAELERLIGP